MREEKQEREEERGIERERERASNSGWSLTSEASPCGRQQSDPSVDQDLAIATQTDIVTSITQFIQP